MAGLRWASLRRSSPGASAAFGEPALAQAPAVVLGVAAPDTRLLVGLEGVLETTLLDRAGGADGDCSLDLVDRRSGRADREEQSRLRIPAVSRSRQSVVIVVVVVSKMVLSL